MTYKITSKEIEAKIKAGKPGRWRADDCLYLRIAEGGSASWVMRYQLNGRQRDMGIGPCALVPLREARERAIAYRRLRLDGTDPIEARKAERMKGRLAAAKAMTFQQCADAYIAAHKAAWRNGKHRDQWSATIATYAEPVIGALPVQGVDTGLVMEVLEPIWAKKPETASRLRGRIEAILDWAKVRGYREAENPARWKGHLDHLLPATGKVRSVRHHTAMAYADVPAFMQALRQRDSVSARALEFAILTAARTSEVIGATWDEIDLGAKAWTIPAGRMKAGKEHRVPLSDRTIDLLQGLPRITGNDFIYPGAKPHRGLSNMSLLQLMRGMGLDCVPHGFRSSFRDWAAERTAYPNHVVEMALAHAIGDKVEAAYRRGDLFDKRRLLMAEWNRFLAVPQQQADNVTAIRQA